MVNISKLFSISKIQASKLVNSLKEKGFLEIKITRNETKQIENRILTPIKFLSNTSLTNVNAHLKNIKLPIEEKFTDNKNNNYQFNNLPNMFKADYSEYDFNDNK